MNLDEAMRLAGLAAEILKHIETDSGVEFIPGTDWLEVSKTLKAAQ